MATIKMKVFFSFSDRSSFVCFSVNVSSALYSYLCLNVMLVMYR